MTTHDLCNAATYLCGEIPANSSADYEARSFTLLALIYNECAPLDAVYRKTHDLPEGSWTNGILVGRNDPFPLSDVFLSAVVYALGALFVLDENSELSALLYARYVAYLDEIRRSIPAVVAPTVDRYHLF